VVPLRIGLVGAGWIAADHVAALGREGESITAVCDLDEGSAGRLAGPLGARTYVDWEELYEREELDAVWLCTPPRAHRGPAVAALERGINLFLEKPIARTAEAAAEIVAAADRSDAVCAIGYQWHGLDLLDDLKEILGEQTVGLLVGRSIGPTQSRPWFLDRAEGGGNVLERASHHIDLARAVGGRVESVQAAASSTLLARSGEAVSGDIDDAVALVLGLAGGGVASIDVAWTRVGLPGVYTLDVIAEEATLELKLDPDFVLRGVSRGRAVEVASREHPFQRTVACFLTAARAGDKDAVFCSPADAAETLAVAVACEEALTSGGTVSIANSLAP
jgi:predicted dehydrogenase